MKYKKIILIAVAVCAFLLVIKSIVDYADVLESAKKVAGTPYEDMYKANFFWFLIELLFRASIGAGSLCVLHEITTEKDYIARKIVTVSRKTNVIENNIKELKEKIKE